MDWLEGFRAWRAGQISTADYREQESAAARIRQAQEFFTGRELMRLEFYRRAVAAEFYNERSA